jgi:hypothetical protein
MLRMIAEKKGKLIITTDHGTIRVKRPYKIVGDRNTNTNLRYKHGKNLGFTRKTCTWCASRSAFPAPRKRFYGLRLCTLATISSPIPTTITTT